MMIASRLSGLPPAMEAPIVHFLPAEQMCKAVDMCDQEGAKVIAHYDMERRILTLPVGWSSGDPQDMSSLVHEMVHHLQAEKWPRDEDRPCRGRVEEMAYDVQEKFLRSMGLELEVDPFYRIVLTMCED